jgi:tetratricopeptide (TPR) repeat protein
MSVRIHKAAFGLILLSLGLIAAYALKRGPFSAPNAIEMQMDGWPRRLNIAETARPLRASHLEPTQTISEPNEAIQMIRRLRDSGSYQGAKAKLLELLARNPDDIEAVRELLIIYHTGIPDYEKALDLEEKLLISDTHNEAEFERYREIAQLAKAESRALAFLEQLEPADSTLAFAVPRTAGRILEAQREYAKAIDKYQEALNLPNERNSLILEDLASAQIKAHSYREAQISLEKAILEARRYNEVDGREVLMELSTRNAELQLLDVYLNNGQYQKLLDLAQRLLKTDSQNQDLKDFREMAIMGLNHGKRPQKSH